MGRLFLDAVDGRAFSRKRPNIVAAAGRRLLTLGHLLQLLAEPFKLTTLVILRLLITHHGLELLEFLCLLGQLVLLLLVDLLFQQDHVLLDIFIPIFVFVPGLASLTYGRLHLCEFQLLGTNLVPKNCEWTLLTLLLQTEVACMRPLQTLLIIA